MGDSPIPPRPDPVTWRYSFQANGRSLATFLGDVVIDGTSTVVNALTPLYATPAAAAVVPNLAATYPAIQTMGIASPGDGGGALYVQVAGPVIYGGFQSEDGQWWQAVPFNGFLNVLAFTGIPNGVSDYGPAIAAADAAAYSGAPGVGATLLFNTSGTGTTHYYTVATSISIGNPCMFIRRAILSPTGSAVITLRIIIAGRYQIFNATPGQIICVNQDVGFPEWFGGFPGSPTIDCSTAINCCILGFPITELLVGAYYIAGPIFMYDNGRTLRGVTSTQNCCASTIGGPGTAAVDPNATQIILTNPAMIGIIVGPFSLPPARPATLVTNVTIENLTVVRATALVPLGISGAQQIENPPSGFSPFQGVTCPIGVMVNWCGLCHFRNVFCIENSIDFYIYGVVECFWDNCRGLRFTPGQVPANDFWNAFFLDNSAPSGYNSGNASIYINRCQGFSNFGISGAPAYSTNYGVHAYQGFTDTYVTQLEVGTVGNGIYLNGRQSSAPDYQSEDVFIENCFLDQCGVGGIGIITCGPDTAIKITDCYIALQTNANQPYAIGVANVFGIIVVSGCQFLGAVGNTALGVSLSSVAGLTFDNNTHTDIKLPYSIISAKQLQVFDIINAVQVAPTHGAIEVDGWVGGKCEPQITASESLVSIPVGINFQGTSSSNVEVNCTSIVAGSITGGADAKVMYNNAGVTALGTFGSNCLLTGIFNA